MSQLVSVDLSVSGARLVVADATFRQTVVQKREHVERLPDESMAAFLTRLAQHLPPLGMLVVSAAGRMVSTRRMRFPLTDMRKIEPAVGFELENLAPYATEDLAITYNVVQRDKASTELLVASTPKKEIETRLQELTAAGLEPRALLSPAATLAELAPLVDESVAVVSAGGSETHVAIVKKGQLRFARTVRTGGDDIDRALAKRFGLSLADAKQAKEREALATTTPDSLPAEARAMAVTVADALGSLAAQLAATFKSVDEADAPRRILLTGGLSRLDGLGAFLTAKLQLPTDLVDVPAAIVPIAAGEAGQPIALGPEYAVAAAMLTQLVRRGTALPLNFRRGRYAYQGDIELVRGSITRIAMGVAAVVLLAIVGSIVRYAMVSAEEKKLNQAFCEVTKKIVGKEYCDPTAAESVMRDPGLGSGIVIPSYTAADVFEMMSSAIGPDVDVRFTELDIRAGGRGDDADRASGKGEAASFEAAERIAASLKRDACVQSAEVSKLRKTREGDRVEFQMSMKLGCPPGVTPGQQLSAMVAPLPIAAEGASAADIPPPDAPMPQPPMPGVAPGVPGMPGVPPPVAIPPPPGIGHQPGGTP